MLFRRAGSPNTRFVAIDTDQSVWVAGHDGVFASSHIYEHLNAEDLSTIAADTFDSGPSGGHGGHITTARVLWSTDLFGDDGIAGTLDGYSQRTVLGTGVTTRPHLLNHHCFTQDSIGRIWASGLTTDLYRMSADGLTIDPFSMGASSADHARTLCYNPWTDDVWTAHHSPSGNTVRRWNVTTGALIASIAGVTDQPRGIGVDGFGKVWVSLFGSNQVKRIDPATNLVDLTLALGASASPYGFTDFGGMIAFTVTQPSGLWHVIYDHGSQASWGRVSWTETTPAVCQFFVERRISLTRSGLLDQPWTLAANGVLFGRQAGQFVEIRATFLRPDQSVETPILFDLTLETLETPVEPVTAPCASQIVQPRHLGVVVATSSVGSVRA